MENDNLFCGPGRSVYCIGFYVDNFHYLWSVKRSGYYNEITKVIFNNIPLGAYDLEWSLYDPDREDIIK